jgi:hypothetical protein
MPVGSNGLIERHGWLEQGGRRVGEYGNAWHAGACFGVGWRPFEISPEGTRAYVWRVLFMHALATEAELLRLAERPAIILSFAHCGYLPRTNGWASRERFNAPYAARVVPGDLAWSPEYIRVGSDYVTQSRLPSYESALQNKVTEAETTRAALRAEATACFARIDSWRLGALRDEQRVATVHYMATGARSVHCGSRSHGISTTDDRMLATCGRCQKALTAADAYNAAQASKQADGETLVAWLTARGASATVAEIKKGLGWDVKRFNAAFDLADRARLAQRDYGSATTRYTTGSRRREGAA